MERLEFDLLFRWFVGLGIDDAVWDHSSFSKNRDRLLEPLRPALGIVGRAEARRRPRPEAVVVAGRGPAVGFAHLVAQVEARNPFLSAPIP